MKTILSVLVFFIIVTSAYTAMYPGNDLISRKIAEEGIVLLRNEGSALPLSPSNTVAVFGPNQLDYYQTGGGTATIISDFNVNIPQGIADAASRGKVKFYEPLFNEYKANKNLTVTAEKAKEIAEFADTAVVCVSSTCGEGADRKVMKGDWFLSDGTEEAFKAVSRAGFKKVIAVLNVCGPMDTSWIDAYKPDAIVYCSMPGTRGGDAVARILTGEANPSGHLVDTWAKTLENYPGNEDFFEPRYMKYVEDIFVGYRYFNTIPGKSAEIRYPFGFGLSYTTFKTSDTAVGADGPNVVVTAKVTNTGKYAGKEVVQIYVSAPKGKLDKPAMELRAFAKTQTLAPGASETVRLTFPKTEMASYDAYGITGNKAAWVLEGGEYKFYMGNGIVDAAKHHIGSVNITKTVVTKQLKTRFFPTELEKTLTSDGSYEKVPGYNPKGGKTYAPVSAIDATVIEGEDYELPIGSMKDYFSYPNRTWGGKLAFVDSRGSGAEYPLEVEKGGKYDIYFRIIGPREGGSFEIFADKAELAEVTAAQSDYTKATVTLPAGKSVFKIATVKPYGNIDRFIIVPAGKDYLFAQREAYFKLAENEPAARNFTYKERTTVSGKVIRWEDVIKDRSLLHDFTWQLSDVEAAVECVGHGIKVAGACGNIGSMEDLGCPGLDTFDGGQGVRLQEHTTAMPSLIMTAASWNTHLVDDYYRAVTREAEMNKINLWLAPGLNIHRHPLCGRNFEYFSEDPLVTGKFGAAFVRAAHKYGMPCMIKHLAVNSRELNRFDGDSVVTDRAMREIYLRGFQRAVQEGDALYIMTSHNLANGIEISENKNLLTGVLREEWGFKGIVATDWCNDSDHIKEILAGNNIKMPGADVNYIMLGLAEGKITRKELFDNAELTFATLLRSYDYERKAEKD